MPTGYTARIDDSTTFVDFALTCARAFGATITMRDDSLDVPIPDAFEASDYNQRALITARSRLAELGAMSPADRDAAAAAEYDRRSSDHAKRVAERKAKRVNYDRLLILVRAWTPPTVDHVGMKKFMIEQLESTIDADCSDKYDTAPVLMSGAAWHAKQTEDAERDIAYHTNGHAEELARVETRNKWVRDLRDSLRAK